MTKILVDKETGEEVEAINAIGDYYKLVPISKPTKSLEEEVVDEVGRIEGAQEYFPELNRHTLALCRVLERREREGNK
jgi:hypothetical protein